MNSLLLASPCQHKFSNWKQGLNSFACATYISDKFITDSLDKLKAEVLSIKPQILLMDLDLIGVDGSHDIAGLRRLCEETQIIIMSSEISEDLEWELLKAGVRGCCQNDSEPKLVNQVVMAVQEGELWIRRTLTSRFINELSKISAKNKSYRATLGLLNRLTQREYDIAVRVANGESNKQIAQSCDITERTVKAHLTEIFLKLGVSDRLNLALVLVSDNRLALSNSESSIQGGSRITDNQPRPAVKNFHIPDPKQPEKFVHQVFI